MPRKGLVSHRETKPDAIYQTQIVQKFINCMMWDGKKATTEKIFYDALDKTKGKGEDDPLKLFKKAIENVKPLMEVKSRRVGGANYQIPVEVTQDRRNSLGIRWILEAARKRGEKGMTDRLAAELLDAFNNRGTAVKKKEDTHRMAEANRAFAHYRW